MSVISEKIRVALRAKLNVSGVLASGTGYATAVYYQKAPANAVTPYVIFNRVAPGPVKRPVLGALVLEDDLWQIEAVTEESNHTTLGPVELGQDILEDCETAIGETLTISGNTVEYCKRVSDIPGYPEFVNNRHVFHEGFNLRTQTS